MITLPASLVATGALVGSSGSESDEVTIFVLEFLLLAFV